MTRAFGIVTHRQPFKVDERITIGELTRVLQAGGYCLSNGIDGELVIHQMPREVRRQIDDFTWEVQ